MGLNQGHLNPLPTALLPRHQWLHYFGTVLADFSMRYDKFVQTSRLSWLSVTVHLGPDNARMHQRFAHSRPFTRKPPYP